MMWLLHRKKKNAPPITADSTKVSWPSSIPIPVLVNGTFLPAGEGPLAATSVASDLTNLWIMKFWAYKYRCRSAYVATKWISSKRSCSSSWNPISLTRVKCVPSPLSPLVCTIPICIYNSISVHFSKNKLVHNSSSEGYWQDTTKWMNGTCGLVQSWAFDPAFPICKTISVRTSRTPQMGWRMRVRRERELSARFMCVSVCDHAAVQSQRNLLWLACRRIWTFCLFSTCTTCSWDLHFIVTSETETEWESMFIKGEWALHRCLVLLAWVMEIWVAKTYLQSRGPWVRGCTGKGCKDSLGALPPTAVSATRNWRQRYPSMRFPGYGSRARRKGSGSELTDP